MGRFSLLSPFVPKYSLWIIFQKPLQCCFVWMKGWLLVRGREKPAFPAVHSLRPARTMEVERNPSSRTSHSKRISWLVTRQVVRRWRVLGKKVAPLQVIVVPKHVKRLVGRC